MAQPRLTVLFVSLPHRKASTPPRHQTAGSAGIDLTAAIPDPWTFEPLQRRLVPTGIAMELPEGFEGQIRPRSGLALTEGLTVLNAPGTIDSDYRGELQVLLINLSDRPVVIRPNDRIAQLVVAPYAHVTLWEVKGLPGTERGTEGFGSTGQ